MKNKLIKKKLKEIAVKSSILWDPLYRISYKIFKTKFISIPPLKNRLRVGSWKIGRFIEGGYLGFLPIHNSISKLYTNDDIKILDFGAGVGRTLQHMSNKYMNLYAVDVDKTAIEYLKKNYKNIISIRTDYFPPILFRDNYFDIVYSVSIWTHLPLDLQLQWLLEIKRILKPNGLALITTSGFKALELRQRRDEEWKNVTFSELREKGIIYIEYSHFKSDDGNFPGIINSYGLTAHSPSYIREEWGKYFKVVEIQENVIDNIQDLIILKNE